jgi:hypothetical protein
VRYSEAAAEAEKLFLIAAELQLEAGCNLNVLAERNIVPPALLGPGRSKQRRNSMVRTYVKYGALLAALTMSTAAFAQSGYWRGPGWGSDPDYSNSGYGYAPEAAPEYVPAERPYNGWNDDQPNGWGSAQPAYGWSQPDYGSGYASGYGWNGRPGYDNGYRTYNGSPYNGDGETGQYMMQSGTQSYPEAAQAGGIDTNPPNDFDEAQPLPRTHHRQAHHAATHGLYTGRAAAEHPANTPSETNHGIRPNTRPGSPNEQGN